MPDPRLQETLSEAEFELLMLWVDGELDGDPPQLAAAQELARNSETARAIADDWRAAKGALRQQVLSAPSQVDFSMLRGRVMTKLPADPRPIAVPERGGLWSLLAGLGFGKVSVALGVAAAIAAWLLLTPGKGLREPSDPTETTPSAMAEIGAPPHVGAEDEPAVILEEMELESGSITVHPGEHAGDATVIWHFQSTGEGEG